MADDVDIKQWTKICLLLAMTLATLYGVNTGVVGV